MNGNNVNRMSNSTNNKGNMNDFPDFDSFKSSFNTDTSEVNNSDKNNDNTNNSDSFNPFANLDMGTIMKMKGVMDKMNSKRDDPRSNLLLSLKPYLKSSRKDKVDQYISLFNMTSIFETLNPMGGEKNK